MALKCARKTYAEDDLRVRRLGVVTSKNLQSREDVERRVFFKIDAFGRLFPT